jgi:hypothetical protein
VHIGGGDTTTTVTSNRPLTEFIDRENKTALLTDIAILFTHNLSNIEAEKITKYEHFCRGHSIVIQNLKDK